jgi:hypothetical protein
MISRKGETIYCAGEMISRKGEMIYCAGEMISRKGEMIYRTDYFSNGMIFSKIRFNWRFAG